ncbi:MAG: MoaD/ThiS family protein [Deltaproteobacteria bacterium]|nr:MoaD/ThiS family protein [Deltaproteobacteria bacterium]
MVTVRFFAMLKGIAKTETKEYKIDGPITVQEFKKVLKDDFPNLAPLLEGRSILISINEEFADKDTLIRDGDEVGLLPPFSGG